MLDIHQIKFTRMDNFAKHMCRYLVWNLDENYFHLLDDIYLLKFYNLPFLNWYIKIDKPT
jgi:hypothetical protein